MLKMVFGRAGSGKTHYVRSLLCKDAKAGRDGLCLIVPDQYSFESERALLQTLGASDARSVEVLGFSRLCDVVFKLYGGRNLPEIDNGTKAVMMRLALDECIDNLVLYRKNASNEEFIAAMLEMVEELKFARITSEQLLDFSNKSNDAILSGKLKEIALIYSAYELQINREYFDPSDRLELLYDKIEKNSYFSGKTVVFDSFFHFSEQQLRIIELAIKQSNDVIVTFCCSGLDDKTPMLSSIRKTALRLVTISNQSGVKIAEPVVLSSGVRFESSELKAVEASIFSPTIKSYSQPGGDVVLCEAATRYEEADFIARTILNLTREKDYRFRDFAVISRNDEICKSLVELVFDKYNIPFFADRRLPLKYQPLVRFVISALKCALSLTTERLLTYLKTGLAGIDASDISLLENYAFVWRISPEMWLNDFDMNPDGFVEGFKPHQKETLLKVNEIRNRAVAPLLKLKSDLHFAQNGRDISRVLFKFLQNNTASKRLSLLAENINEEEQYSKVWDELIVILDNLGNVTNDRKINVKDYLSLFNLIVTAKTIGSIPQHIDEVSIGNAERMRPASPKVVFIIGANDKVFPRLSSIGGILTDHDREELIKNGIQISDRGIEEMNIELSLAYTAVCAASEKLYVCWSKNDTSGENLYPSRIVTDIKRILPNVLQITEKQYIDKKGDAAAEPIISTASALEKQALSMHTHSEFSDSLFEALCSNTDTSNDIKRIKEFSKNQKESMNTDTAKIMFGGNLGLSPTAIESYFRCPFRYFCQYGMGVRMPRTAEMDSMSRGTLVHYCLEHLIGDFGSEKLKTMSEKEITDQVVLLLDRYLNTVMGGEKNKSSRFMRNYKMTVRLVKQLAVFIATEFKQGRFEAAYCELEIGESSSAKIKPIKIKNPDGTEIYVRGYIDRVDICKDGEKTYIRVIDYKTGAKTLSPTDIYNGLNLQMPLYLFTLCKNGEQLFGKTRVPAAVLYMHAADKIVSAERNASQADIENSILTKSRLNGLFLNDDSVIDAMDQNREGKYISLGYTKNGTVRKKTGLVTIDTMNKIEAKINELLILMAKDLKQGKIAADPVDSDSKGDGCKYCDYYSVCRLDKTAPHRQAESMSSYEFEKKEETSNG